MATARRPLRVRAPLTSQLDRIADGTDTLGQLQADIARVAVDTSTLAEMNRNMELIAETMPALLEVERSLDDIRTLLERIAWLLGPVNVALKPVAAVARGAGRLGRRLPGIG